MMSTLDDNRSVNREATLLVAALGRLRSRGQVVTVLKGTGWILTGAFLFFVTLVFALGWWGGDALRTLGWITLGIGIVALATLVLFLPIFHLRGRDAVAHRIGGAFSNLASDVLSANQLAVTGDAGVFSEELVANHLHSVRRSVAELPRGEIYPARIVIWPALALIGSLVAGFGVYTLAPGVVDTGLASLFEEPRPPDQAARRVSTAAPVVGDLSIVLRYPEYLERADRRLDTISGGLRTPLGTTVVLEGRSLVDGAVRGVANLPGGGKSPLIVDTDRRVRGRFVVGAAGVFSLALGTKSLLVEGPERRLAVEPDSPPTIRLLRPNGAVEVAEDGEIVIDFEAEDDHGLKQVDLILRAGPRLELRKTIIRLTDRVKQLRTSYRWTPESVRTGEETEIRLELEVYDNDNIFGPKPGRSDPLDVRVLTPQSRHKTVAKEESETLDALIDLLASRLENLPHSNKHPGDARERFVRLRRETEDVLGRTARLIRSLGQDRLTPPRVADVFYKIRQDLSNQLLHEARLHGDVLADFNKRRGVDRVTTRILESAVIRVDDLLIEQQLSRVVRAGGALDGQWKELGELLKRYSSNRAESARRALLDAIEGMEQSIAKLERDMELIRGTVGDTYLNPTSVVQLDLLGSLARLRALLAEGDLEGAARQVARLETEMGRLLAGLEGGLLSFRTERFGEGERFIGDLLDKLMSIEAGQLQLRRETTALQRRYQERLIEVMRGKIDPLVKRQLTRVSKMLGWAERVPDPPEELGRVRLVQLRVAVRELKLALGQGDLDEARQASMLVAEIGEDWSSEVGEVAPDAILDLKRAALKLGEEISEAYPRPAQLMSKRDRGLTRSQTVKQRLLLITARKLRAWARDQGEATRFLSGRAESALRAVASHMSRAIAELEGKQVRRALMEQSAALDELVRLREDLKKGGEVAPLDNRPVVLRGRVELPQPDDYEVPPEFREDILEAMHGDLPSQYREAIRKYYETLVQ